MRDVARLAGTSISAVSAVLNEKAHYNIRVGPQTRERIRAAARELGYTPNLLARSLVTGKTGMLGVVFPYASSFTDLNPFTTQLMCGVFDEVTRRRYNIMLHTAAGNEWNVIDETALIDPRVDGLILIIPAPNSPVVARCRRERFPYVTVVYEPDSPEVYAVNADDVAGGRLGTEHLIGLGHRRIAYLVGTPGVSTTEPRRKGYLAALEEAGIAPTPALILRAGYDWKGGAEATKRLLDLPPAQRPTAIFAANDLCAEGVLRTMRERGLRVPDDMAVVGYDDTWFATLVRPNLTSVHMPIYTMGAHAAQMLIAQAEGRAVEERQPVLSVSLTVRDSCGPPSS